MKRDSFDLCVYPDPKLGRLRVSQTGFTGGLKMIRCFESKPGDFVLSEEEHQRVKDAISAAAKAIGELSSDTQLAIYDILENVAVILNPEVKDDTRNED